MLQGSFILAALLVVWFEHRHPARNTDVTWVTRSNLAVDGLLLGLVLISGLDALPLLLSSLHLPGYLPGDSSTHALVAAHLFDGDPLPSWSDRYVGGFPLAIHYPIVGWLLIALGTGLGASAAVATLTVGYILTLGLPALAYVLARRSGAHFLPCLIVSLLATWLAPHTPFTGGLGTFAVMGLVSQIICMPLAILWVALVFGRGSIAAASAASILCILAHPQIASIGIVLLGFAVVVTGSRRTFFRFVTSSVAAVVVAALVYGPGLASMGVPFEWPALPRWMQLGFGPDRLGDWFVDGLLLDRARPPVVTSLWLGSFLLLCTKLRQSAAARAAVASSILIVLLATMGPWLSQAGSLGPALLRVFQPLRALACVPIVVLGTILIALEQHRSAPRRMLEILAAHLTRLGRTATLRRFPKLLGLSAIFVSLGLGVWLASTLRSAHRWQIALWTEEFRHFPVDRPCGDEGPSSAQMTALKATLSQLDGGRLWYDPRPNGVLGLCAVTTGFERITPIPIAPTSGVGAHVGLLHEANLRLTPYEPGLAERARALGIRHVLVASPLGDEEAKGFRLVEQHGPLSLYERNGTDDLFGVGCIEGALEGRPRELHLHLLRLLGTTEGRQRLLNPRHFTELKLGPSALKATARSSACYPEARAKITEGKSRPGRYEAVVDADEDITVVLRATAHRGWHVTVDGAKQSGTLVSPGYFAYAVPKGRHELRAVHRASPSVLLGFVLVPLLPLLVWWLERRRLHGRGSSRHRDVYTP
jgi:hypothetical protein